MFWFFLLDNLISFQGKQFKIQKEKIKGQQHLAPGPPETLHWGLCFYIQFQFLLNSDSLNLSPMKSTSSEKPHLPIPVFNTTVSPLWFPSPALSNNSHVIPTHLPSNIWIKCTSRHAQDIKTSTPFPVSTLPPIAVVDAVVLSPWAAEWRGKVRVPHVVWGDLSFVLPRASRSAQWNLLL